jgi:hypothetical protein
MFFIYTLLVLIKVRSKKGSFKTIEIKLLCYGIMDFERRRKHVIEKELLKERRKK